MSNPIEEEKQIELIAFGDKRDHGEKNPEEVGRLGYIGKSWLASVVMGGKGVWRRSKAPLVNIKRQSKTDTSSINK